MFIYLFVFLYWTEASRLEAVSGNRSELKKKTNRFYVARWNAEIDAYSNKIVLEQAQVRSINSILFMINPRDAFKSVRTIQISKLNCPQ